MVQLLKTRKEILKWLNIYQIKSYSLVDSEEYGFIVNVDGHVWLSGNELKQLQVKFKHIAGTFDCSDNKLVSLIGSPIRTDGDFWCNNNELKTLTGGPEYVGNNFDCGKNFLSSLEFCPKEINGNFCFGDNKIKNIAFFPEKIKGTITLFDNPISNGLSPFYSNMKYVEQKHKEDKIIHMKEEIEYILLSENKKNINKKNKI